ncbi:hypothetical protein Pfo_014271 [Paulownia fortunei]|nr:hypothetical protein Pfo_014271 [Paulownia fortunei]
MKQSLLLGAEKLLMARKSPGLYTCSTFEPHDDNEGNTSKNRISEGKYASQQTEKVHGRYKLYAIDSSLRHFDRAIESRNENVDMSKLVNCSWGRYNDRFPLNIIASLAVLVLKLVGFQISLLLRFFTFPIWVLNFWLMFLMLPFQTLMRIREHMKKRLLRACSASYSRLISFISYRLKLKKSVMKPAIRFSKAFFCSLYVFLVLVGLLVLGFMISGIIMRNLAEEPMLMTENLNIDYTKTSPAAIVPITSSLVTGVPSKDEISPSENLRRRSIPYNHKMQLTVSLTLPESEYNRKLGIFQVRVESLSANGKVIFGSSYPNMLRFKSKPIHFIESLLKSFPLITGLQSEVQYLKIVIGEFAEGYEPTACFKVILEQRAEFQAGSGVPEIYAASLDIASELTPLKRIVCNWRRTIFVWIGITSFMAEMLVVLLLCRPIILPGGRSKAVATDKKSQLKKNPWTFQEG